MPGRGGRIGGGSRGGGFKAPRISSGGTKGGRINIGSRPPRTASAVPNTDGSNPHPIHYHRPWYRNRLPGTWGTGWRWIGILVTLFLLGMCACVALGVILQALGQGS